MSDPVRFKRGVAIESLDEFDDAPARLPVTYEDEEPDAFARIRAYCDSADAANMLGVYRQVPNSRRENYLCDIDKNEFSPSLIKSRFGGGDYIIKAYDERSKIRLKQSLSIEGAPVADTAQHAAVVAGSNLDTPAIIAAMQENNRQMLEAIMHATRAIPAPPAPSRAEMLQEMAMMREMFAPQQNSDSGMTMLLKGIELAKNMENRTGETSGMDVLLESIKSFAPAVTSVINQSQHQKQTTKPHQLNAPTIKTMQPEQPQPEMEGDMLFNYYLKMLINYAHEGRDVSLYADLIADNLSEEQLNALLNQPDTLQFLISKNADVASYREWFSALINELRLIAGLTDTTQPVSVAQVDTLQATGNDGNNGTTSGNI